MKITLRMDDIGASSKKYEVYSKNKIGNILFLKYFRPFKAWGPYDELSERELENIFELLDLYKIQVTFGITAAWVDKNSRLLPFNEKYPTQSNLIKKAFEKKLIKIANHGLTHCVIGKHLPKLFSSNRKFHREFWEWVDLKTQDYSIKKSQEIFYSWLNYKPHIFVPPGNVYAKKTLEILEKYDFRLISTNKLVSNNISNIKFINPKNVFAFHDRELKLFGINWLKSNIEKLKDNYEIVKIDDI